MSKHTARSLVGMGDGTYHTDLKTVFERAGHERSRLKADHSDVERPVMVHSDVDPTLRSRTFHERSHRCVRQVAHTRPDSSPTMLTGRGYAALVLHFDLGSASSTVQWFSTTNIKEALFDVQRPSVVHYAMLES
jgi:hypothetical protein